MSSPPTIQTPPPAILHWQAGRFRLSVLALELGHVHAVFSAADVDQVLAALADRFRIEVDGVRLTFLDSGDANDLGDATEVRVLKPEFSGDNGSGRY